MGISRDSRHKRSATGAKRAFYRKKRCIFSSIMIEQRSNQLSTDPSRKVVNQQILVSAINESILCEFEVAIPNTVHFVLTPVTSPGEVKEWLEKFVS